MVMQRIQKGVESKLGIPPLENLSQMKETLNTINCLVQALDKEKVKSIQKLMEGILKIQVTGGQKGLTDMTGIIKIIADVPPERLDKIVKVADDIRSTAEVVRDLVKLIPPDMMKNFKLSDIAGKIKEEMQRR